MAVYTTASIPPITIDVSLEKFMMRANATKELEEAVNIGVRKGIDNFKPQLEKKFMEHLRKYGLADSDIARNYSFSVDSDFTIKLTIGTEWAIFVEYGTGIVGKQAPHHPKPELPWVHDSHGHGDKGWVYEKDGRFRWTAGQASRPFMYDTWKWARASFTNTLASAINKEIKNWGRKLK